MEGRLETKYEKGRILFFPFSVNAFPNVVYLLFGGCIGSWWGSWRERDHWGGLGVDGWIILGWISRRWDVGVWTGPG